MMIRVMYSDLRQDMVSPEALDRLLALRRVKKFKRCSGWVPVGYDRVRSTGGGATTAQNGVIYHPNGGGWRVKASSLLDICCRPFHFCVWRGPSPFCPGIIAEKALNRRDRRCTLSPPNRGGT
jgi:hypothetical protein